MGQLGGVADVVRLIVARGCDGLLRVLAHDAQLYLSTP